MEYSFNDIWTLLQPKSDYDQLRGICRELWNSFSLDLRHSIYDRIEEKKKRKEFVDYNPLWAIRKNNVPSQKQILSFNDYYARFGTTEEQNGWKMENPTGNKVIYTKAG